MSRPRWPGRWMPDGLLAFPPPMEPRTPPAYGPLRPSGTARVITHRSVCTVPGGYAIPRGYAVHTAHAGGMVH
jgi:hypothetical protein